MTRQTLASMLRDSARATDKEIKRDHAGSIYWIRQCGDKWIVTADGSPICAPTTYQRAIVNLTAVTW